MPELSVILAVGERRDRAVRALASILAQSAVERLEVLLLDCAPGEPPSLPGSDHPADELEDLLRAEIVLHGRLRRDGHRLLLEPAARFAHLNESSLGSIIRGRFLWNRCYGPSRALTFGWPAARRIVYVVATPLIPLYALAKITWTLARTRPEQLRTLFRWLPHFLAAHLATAAGQAVGLLVGTGDSESRFTLFELNEPRAE